jgi:hypothetical protein
MTFTLAPFHSWAQTGSVAPRPPAVLCIDQSCAPAPASNSRGVKWHPGHYVWLAGFFDLPNFESQLAGICANSDIEGVQVIMRWAQLEGATLGNYTAGFSLVDSLLSQTQACDKRLMIHILVRTFGSVSSVPTISKLSETYPPYLMTSTYGTCCGVDVGDSLLFGAVATADIGNVGWGGLGSASKVWEPAVMSRLIALSDAYAARYDDHPYFEMLSIGESAIGAHSSSGFSAAGWYTQLKRFHTEAAEAWPTTVMRIVTNYTQNDSQMKDLFEHCARLANCVIGGPDPDMPAEGPYTRPIQANMVFRGERCNGCTASDYRGELAFVGELQGAGYSVSGYPMSTAAQINDYYDDVMNKSYMIWNRELQGEGLSPVLTEIAADPTQHTTRCPANFPSCNSD